MSIKWFKACTTAPTKSEKYLVSLKGVYFLAQFDVTAGIFYIEGEDELQVPLTDLDLYWSSLMDGEPSLSLLVVDDDPDDMKEIISAVHYISPSIMVNTADSAKQALDYLSSDVPDKRYPNIILLDLYMPDEDGFHVLKSVRSNPELATTKVYVLSSTLSISDWDLARDLGATAMFHKSNAKIELARVLSENHLQDSRPEKA